MNGNEQKWQNLWHKTQAKVEITVKEYYEKLNYEINQS
jgi:hypothetical protein